MTEPNVRWKQRFHNYRKALIQLGEAVNLQKEWPLSNIEKQGFVKAFEFTHELAWNVMKDYFFYRGNTQIMGSRDATREAFQRGMISEGDDWMGIMIKTRNKAVHTYDESIADEIIGHTIDKFYPLFLIFKQRMQRLIEE